MPFPFYDTNTRRFDKEFVVGEQKLVWIMNYLGIAPPMQTCVLIFSSLFFGIKGSRCDRREQYALTRVDTLEADSILLEYGTKKILTDIYLKCETGQIIGLLGRNGQGKTSLMNVIFGNLNPTHKSLRFNNKVVPKAFKNSNLLTYLPQFNFIPSHLTLKRIFSDFELEFSDFEQIFSEFSYNLNSTLKSLSGGQRRLIEVYCIIKSKSHFSMLDEPFSHLMPLQIEKIMYLLERTKKTKGFLITDHLFNHIIKISNHLYALKDGKTHLIKNKFEIEKLGYTRF